jgi:hypothetical protein
MGKTTQRERRREKGRKENKEGRGEGYLLLPGGRDRVLC